MDPGSSSSLQPSKDTKDLPVEVLEAWNLMTERQISKKLIEKHSRPHLTLFQSDSVDVFKQENVVKSVGSTQDLHLPVSLSKFESPADEHNVFLVADQSAELLEFQSQLCDAMKKEGIENREEYQPEKWKPKCLIAQGVQECLIDDAFAVCVELELPFSGHGVEIALVECPPDPIMTISLDVELYFDPKLEKQVLEAFDLTATYQKSAIEKPAIPHIILFRSDSVDVDKIEKVRMPLPLPNTKLEPELCLPFSFNHIGSNLNIKHVFLAVNPSIRLHEFQSLLCDAMIREGIHVGKEYRSEQWNPQCIIAKGVEESEIQNVISAVSQAIKLPISGYGLEIAWVECKPERVIVKTYSVLLYFDSKLEDEVLKYSRLMEDNGFCKKEKVKQRPHITLLHIDNVDVRKLECVCVNLPLPKRPNMHSKQKLRLSIDLTLERVKIPPMNNTLYLLADTTDSLLKFQSQLCDVMKKEDIEIREECKPDNWSPECLFAQEVHESTIEEALEALSKLKLPIKGYGMEIALVECQPDPQ